VSPLGLREIGRREAARYNVSFLDCEVVGAERIVAKGVVPTRFRIDALERHFHVRAVLLATGMVDHLPEIPGTQERYGKSIHHCPYCDGWEHRGQRLVALGGGAAAKLAAMLRGWSREVSLCTNGQPLDHRDRALLTNLQIPVHTQMIRRFAGALGDVQSVVFVDETTIPFDAIFFSSGQGQRSKLPKTLGCECNDEDLVLTVRKQLTSENGVFLAGDADGDVQFSIVAAAEGAIAATAIHQALLDQDQHSR
jgi:thioredoxin reductase